MAYTEHRTMRRVLRREIAGTIGLLTDEHDFTAMRRYRTFTFDDHDTYLQQVEALLRTLAPQGSHTTVALFDPEEYAEFCADNGLEPDTAASRTRFTAELAATGPTVPYEGQPLADLLPDLVDEAVRQATWEYATTLLARLGACAACGEDIGRAAFARASHLLTRILDTAGPGEPPPRLQRLRRHPRHSSPSCTPTTTPTAPTRLDDAEALEFTTVLAVGLATGSAGGLVMRTTAPGHPRPCPRLATARRRPRNPSPQARSSTPTAPTSTSGDLISPESGVDYCAPPDLGGRTSRGDRPHALNARGAPPAGGAPLTRPRATNGPGYSPDSTACAAAARLVGGVRRTGGRRRPLALRQRVLRQRRAHVGNRRRTHRQGGDAQTGQHAGEQRIGGGLAADTAALALGPARPRRTARPGRAAPAATGPAAGSARPPAGRRRRCTARGRWCRATGTRPPAGSSGPAARPTGSRPSRRTSPAARPHGTRPRTPWRRRGRPPSAP